MHELMDAIRQVEVQRRGSTSSPSQFTWDSGEASRRMKMATMQQIWDNSCAAASLLCATYELGVREFPAVRKYSLWAAPAPLRLDSESQRRIYQWTSHNPAMTTMPYDWGYSWPVDIATCAEALGLYCRILIYST